MRRTLRNTIGLMMLLLLSTGSLVQAEINGDWSGVLSNTGNTCTFDYDDPNVTGDEYSGNFVVTSSLQFSRFIYPGSNGEVIAKTESASAGTDFPLEFSGIESGDGATFSLTSSQLNPGGLMDADCQGTVSIVFTVTGFKQATLDVTVSVSSCSRQNDSRYTLNLPCQATFSGDLTDTSPTIISPIPTPKNISLKGAVKNGRFTCTLKINKQPKSGAKIIAEVQTHGVGQFNKLGSKKTNTLGKAIFPTTTVATGDHLRCKYTKYYSKEVTFP